MTAKEYDTPRHYICRHGAKNPCPTRAWRVTMSPREMDNRNNYVPCPTCGRERMAEPIRGKVSQRHKCGARCMASMGPDRTCLCGGANHGASYSAQQ